MTIDEQIECEQAVLASPEFKAALKKHYGIDDTQLVMVDIWSAGNYGTRGRPHAPAGPAAVLPPHRPDRQRLRPAHRRAAAGGRSQRDEGDPRRGVRPLAAAAAAGQLRRRPRRPNSAPTSSRWRSRSRRGRASRSTATRCAGRSGASSSASTPAKGLTLHHLCYHDNGKQALGPLPRLALGDGGSLRRPGPAAGRKNAFDAGEYGLGMCANSLELGCDCLGLIKYFDGHLCTSRGEPLTDQERRLHARGGLRHPLEAHRPPAANTPEVRRSRRLVDLVDRHGRELRVRLLLVSLPGRQHPVRDQADRHPVAGRAAAGREVAVRQR